jgi:flagellar M-ring protein FliF
MPPAGERTAPLGQLAELAASLRRQWQALQPGQRRAVLAAGGLALAGLVGWAVWSARGPAMAPLFTNLAPVDGAAIVAQLDRSKVPYRLADGGRTVLVPAASVDRLRLQFAGQGLPSHGAVGLSSVLNLPFGATDFTRQVAYQDALQGELEATIDQIDGVAGSRVQIVLPQPPSFGGSSSPPSAAVLLDLQPGVTLDSGQVRGIARLVASSVQGLTPDNVTVIDQTGRLLWAQGAAPGGAGASGAAGQAQENLQVQQQFDRELQQGLQHLLEQVFGPGNVIAQVSADLSFTSGTVDRLLYQPPGSSPAVLQSMQELKQSVSGAAAQAAVPGTAANSFPTYPAVGAAGPTSSTSDQITQNFDVSQETQHTVIAPGSVSRLSVAVLVNGTLTPAQQSLVQAAVEAAVGADPNRRDQITVVGMPFNQSLLSSLRSQPPARRSLGVPAVPLPVVFGAAALLVALALAAVVLRRPATPPAPLPGVPATAAVSPDGAEAGPDPLGLALAMARADRERAQGALRERPEDVARVIRVWLAQDE